MKLKLIALSALALLIGGCAKKPVQFDPNVEAVNLTAHVWAPTLYLIKYEGRSYLLNPEGGIIEHTPKPKE